ncbi:Crp/Fnr family transcriptional regulator [Aquimarina sp. W85]|uniref:Crp/Fnr family transcriptional regulator n=1 Tax=Aquimarina rhodophyticola TaxID=3342246 RepID=UPI00367143B1
MRNILFRVCPLRNYTLNVSNKAEKPTNIIENLINHITNFIPVSTELKKRLETICEIQNFPKNHFLHKPNRTCLYTYFINSGLARIYYLKDDKEITDNFAAENEWITSIYSFLQNVPDNFHIQTLEETQVIRFSLNDLEDCFKDFPKMERFGRMLISKYFLEQSERIISLQFNSAKERYIFFEQTSKNKLARVPLGMLASHLGMTQETLSRVRSSSNAF